TQTHQEYYIQNWEKLRGRIYNQLNFSGASFPNIHRKDIKSQIHSVDIIMKKLKQKELIRLGTSYRSQEIYGEALKNYEKALIISRQLEDFRNCLEILSVMGDLYKIKGNNLEAVKQYEEALKITEELGEISIKLKLLLKIRALYKDLSNTH
ncbi:MAG: tetratricopeptide repeat protein, partial [Promethearchaeota archaeon]